MCIEREKERERERGREIREVTLYHTPRRKKKTNILNKLKDIYIYIHIIYIYSRYIMLLRVQRMPFECDFRAKISRMNKTSCICLRSTSSTFVTFYFFKANI